MTENEQEILGTFMGFPMKKILKKYMQTHCPNCHGVLFLIFCHKGEILIPVCVHCGHICSEEDFAHIKTKESKK